MVGIGSSVSRAGEHCRIIYNASFMFKAEKKARSDIMLLLRRMELRLKESPFFAGEEMSLADLTIACFLRPLMMTVLGEVERKNFPSVCAWMEKMYSSVVFHPSFHV